MRYISAWINLGKGYLILVALSPVSLYTVQIRASRDFGTALHCIVVRSDVEQQF